MDMEEKVLVVSDNRVQGKDMSCFVAESKEILELCSKIEALGKIVSEVDDNTAESYCVITRS